MAAVFPGSEMPMSILALYDFSGHYSVNFDGHDGFYIENGFAT